MPGHPHGAPASFWAITAPALVWTASFRICCCLFHVGLVAAASAQTRVIGSSLPPSLPLLPGLCCLVQTFDYFVHRQLQQQRWVMSCAAMKAELKANGSQPGMCSQDFGGTSLDPSLLYLSVGVSSLRPSQKLQHVC